MHIMFLAGKILADMIDFAVIGFTQVSGSAQLIGINQRFEQGCIFYYIDGETTIDLKSADNATHFVITIPNMQCTDISSSLQTGTSLVTTSFNFMVMGRSNSTDSDNSLIKYSSKGV